MKASKLLALSVVGRQSRLWSPSDVLLWRESPFAFAMERKRREDPSWTAEMDPVDPLSELLGAKGNEWEQRVKDRFEQVVDLSGLGMQETQDAVRREAPVIYQATLGGGQVRGVADFLVRTSKGQCCEINISIRLHFLFSDLVCVVREKLIIPRRDEKIFLKKIFWFSGVFGEFSDFFSLNFFSKE